MMMMMTMASTNVHHNVLEAIYVACSCVSLSYKTGYNETFSILRKITEPDQMRGLPTQQQSMTTTRRDKNE